MEPILRLNQVSKSFSSSPVLQDISFDVFKNEQVAIIGPSGSGKSTIMNIIAQTLPLDTGEVFVDNKRLNEFKSNKDYAHYVGLIPQNYHLVNSLSVLNNTLMGRLNEWGFWQSLKSLIAPVDKKRALETLASVGIEHKAGQKAGTLSGGEQQRVAIARVLVQNPQIILADEPVSSLDPSRAHEVIRLLIDLSKTHHHTLIASVHSVDLVKEYFTRVIGIRDGRVVINQRTNEITNEQYEALYDLSGDQSDS